MATTYNVNPVTGQTYSTGNQEPTLAEKAAGLKAGAPAPAPAADKPFNPDDPNNYLVDSTGASMSKDQGLATLMALGQGKPDAAAYDTSGLSGYENKFNDQANNTDPAMQQILDLARNQALGLGPSVAQKQSDLAVANAAANARSMAAGARGGSLGQYAAMMGGEAAAGQAAGQTAIARAAEQTGALNAYGNFTQEDVRQRREALNNAAKTQQLMLSTKQAENAANAAYWSQYATMSYNIQNNMNGNTSASINNQNALYDLGGKLIEGAGTAIPAIYDAYVKAHPAAPAAAPAPAPAPAPTPSMEYTDISSGGFA